MRLAAVIMLSGCGADATLLQPVVDLPPPTASASPFPLDFLTLSVAHEGSAIDIKNAEFTHGQTVELSAGFGDDLVVHLTGLKGSSESAYGRTCSFSIDQGGSVPSPHLLFTRSAKFVDMAYQPELRNDGGAIAYSDGSGLLIGGVSPSDATQPIVDIEQFDPRTAEFQRLDGATIQPRTGAVVAALGTGTGLRIAIVGGVDTTTGAGAQFYELITADNPPNRQVDLEPDTNMSMSRVDLTATTLSDGNVVTIGGVAPGSSAPSGAVAELKVPPMGPAEVNQLHATLATPRSQHTATRLGDDVGAPVLVAGGIDMTGAPVATAELFKPLSESFSPILPAMVIPRYHHQTMRMPDGSALIMGGIDATGTPVSAVELFTLDTGFHLLGNSCMPGDICQNSGEACPTTGPTQLFCAIELPPAAGLVDFTATTLPDGRVLLTGGSRTLGGPPLVTAFIANLDPIDGTVEILPTDFLSTPRARHQATLMCDGTVLISGGTTTMTGAERYNPPSAGRR